MSHYPTLSMCPWTKPSKTHTLLTRLVPPISISSRPLPGSTNYRRSYWPPSPCRKAPAKRMRRDRAGNKDLCKSRRTSVRTRPRETARTPSVIYLFFFFFCHHLNLFFFFFLFSKQEYNIRTAAQYFADTLKENDNNVLLTMGTYNGWSKGLTKVVLLSCTRYYGRCSFYFFSPRQSKAKATAARNSSCCRCQNNLD